jgi:hypothetical protein
MTGRYRLGMRLWLLGVALVVLLVIGLVVQSTASFDPGGVLGT